MKELIGELFKILAAFLRWLANLFAEPPRDGGTASTVVGPAAYKGRELGLASADRPQYRSSRSVLSASEHVLHSAIVEATSGRHKILMKVRLGDFVFLANEPEDRRYHINQLMCKHVDFLLCEPSSLRPLLAIELDDERHKHDEFRIDSDRFKNETFEEVGIPLLRLPVRSSSNVGDLASQINAKLNASPPSPPP